MSARARRFTDPARVMLHLYMQASTLAGFDQHPATLLGYGPIGADQARRLAQDAALTRILTDPFTGEIKAIDLPSYRVPKVLKAAVQARDRTCVFPGCDVPAFDAQLDHIDPHPFARRLKIALATGRTSFSQSAQPVSAAPLPEDPRRLDHPGHPRIAAGVHLPDRALLPTQPRMGTTARLLA